MKKSILYILAVAAGLYSCDPYKDLHDSVQDDLRDQRDNDAIPASIEISADDQVFFSMKEAQAFIPSYLDENYQANSHTDGRVVEVSYTVEAKNMTPKSFFTDSDYEIAGNEFCKEGEGWLIDTLKFEDADVEIILEQADYDYLGFRYPNFSDDDFDEGSYQGYTYSSRIEAMISDVLVTQRKADRTKSTAVIFDVYDGKSYTDTLVFKADTLKGCAYHFLPADDIEAKVTTIFNTKYPDQVKDTQSAAVYKVGEIGGDITEHTNFFENEEAQVWKMIAEEDLTQDYYILEQADYDSFGFKYPNFSSSTPQENYLPRFLTNKYPYAQEGDNLRIKYDYYSGSTNEHIVEYTFMNSMWKQVAPYAEEISNMDKFKYKHAETTWVLSQAIVIELETEDYKLTGDDKYNNFGYYDNVEGEYPEGTAVENVIDAKINHILKENYEDINVADQEVSVFYQYYDNGTNTVSRNFIYDAASETWVRQ
ncbi:hypothetical protein [Flammeovirga sp. SJP92]|uniref:hypothetical protein n=1 Tax=Flammeovirga sp. SJP92 TaxID=1775430 RepID=UPI0007886DD6|nr:hypothetical protein [Flammeovirga sp. SJP92]KXX69030.1 hypothetical protein AVL50_17895 [Flammeovirga sp. SJP92]